MTAYLAVLRTAAPRYAKALVAAATAALTAAQSALPMSATTHGWVTVVIAVLGTAGVWAVPNAPAEPVKPPTP